MSLVTEFDYACMSICQYGRTKSRRRDAQSEGVLRYVGGLNLIHVAFSIHVRRDARAGHRSRLLLTVSLLNLV